MINFLLSYVQDLCKQCIRLQRALPLRCLCPQFYVHMVHPGSPVKQLEENNLVLFIQCEVAIHSCRRVSIVFLLHETLGSLVLFMFYIKKPPPSMTYHISSFKQASTHFNFSSNLVVYLCIQLLTIFIQGQFLSFWILSVLGHARICQ